jgi:predicted CXXCH cytochrome family protein
VICTKCHDPHSSSKKKLIISRDKPRIDSNDVVFE